MVDYVEKESNDFGEHAFKKGSTPGKTYDAGPTATEFHNDDSYFRLILGPVGSGKSVACVMENIIRAGNQAPGPDGIRRSKALIVRPTYGELKSTTIKTFQLWVPPNICPIVYDTPIRGEFKQPLADGTTIELELLFMALDRPEDVGKILSLDITWAWINEAREVDEEIFTYIRGRIGRYPLDGNVRPTWKGIFADSNPPKTTNWLYRVFEEEVPPKAFKLFRQPAAVYFDTAIQKWVPNPDAENLNNLDTGYYESQLEGNSEEYIKVMLAGEYGMTLQGKPVFPQYNERDHVSQQKLVPDRSMPLILGFDFGLNPACVFAQLSRLGNLRILKSMAPADVDLESFMDDYILPELHKNFAQYRINGVGDPAARGRSGLDKRTAFDILGGRGIRCVPAHTNNFLPRKEAVDFFLNRRNGFQLDPGDTYLREAFGGGYVYEALKGQRGKYKERPEKNHYSHGCDAVQYVCLYARAGTAMRKAQSTGLTDKDPDKFLWA